MWCDSHNQTRAMRMRKMTCEVYLSTNSAELETVTTSRSAKTVTTANGEVQTHEEATVYVKELDFSLDNESPQGYASSFIARKALR